MKTTKQMAAVIGQIAARHGLDLHQPEQHLSLDNGPWTRLVIETLGPDLVSICHYPAVGPEEDAIRDPDMVFFTGYGDAGWVPVEMTLATGYYQRASVIEGGTVKAFYPRAQAEQAAFANLWARNLRAQGWTRSAVVTA